MYLDFSAVTVEQFDLERNAKKISGFEHIAPKYETDKIINILLLLLSS
jgi:hypothetical protein